MYEAKLFHQYDHRFATFDGVSERDIRNGNARPITVAEKSDPESVAIPRYWVPEKEVAARLDKGEMTLKSLAEPSRAVLYTLSELARSSLFGISSELRTSGRE